MPNQMQYSLFCECGGQYQHVDTEDNGNGTYDDSYQCDTCEGWCIVTWNKEADEETGRRYEAPDS